MSPTTAEPAPSPDPLGTDLPPAPHLDSAASGPRHPVGWGAVVGLALAVGAFVALAVVAFHRTDAEPHAA